MREIEMTAKTVEEALEAACRALGVDRDDLGVSYEVLEFPARKLFRSIPAKVRVKVAEPEAPAAPTAPQAPAASRPRKPRKPRPPRKPWKPRLHRKPGNPPRKPKPRLSLRTTRSCRLRLST